MRCVSHVGVVLVQAYSEPCSHHDLLRSASMLTTAHIPDYLQPEFDAKSLTVNDLVRILVSHNVSVPLGKAKKEV